MLANGVCNMMQRKKLGVTVLLSDLGSKIYRFWVNFIRKCCHSNGTLAIKTAIKNMKERKYVKIHEQFNTDLFKFNSAKIRGVK